jgi:hypothetical protein
LGRFPFPFRSSRPNPLQTAAHQTLPLSLLFITCRQPGPACRPTALPYPHLFFPASDSHRTGRLAPRPCARDGTASPPDWPARRATGAHARARVGPSQGGFFLFCPRVARPCSLACAEEAGATSAARAVKAGVAWGFRIDACGAGLQKQGEAETPGAQATNPFGVFDSFFFLCVRADRGEAPPLRRAGGAEHGPGARSWTRGRPSP